MNTYKKTPSAEGANRRSDILKSENHSSTWDRNLQDRMDQSGVPRGGRNIEMVKLACDIVWAGLLTEGELFDFFRNRYDSDLKDYEIRNATRWAYDVTTPRASTNTGRPLPYRTSPSKTLIDSWKAKHNPQEEYDFDKVMLMLDALAEIDFFEASPIKLEDPKVDQALLIESLFNSDDWVASIQDGYGGRPKVELCEKLLERSQPFMTTHSGGHVWANAVSSPPEIDGYKSVSKKHIASFRHMVIESDDLPLHEQLKILGYIMPFVKAIVFSGNKSYHAVLDLDTESAEAHDKARNNIGQMLDQLQFDKASMSYLGKVRMPHCERNGEWQRLIYLNPNPTEKTIFTVLKEGILDE